MKDNWAYIEHIILCINKIEKYTENISHQDFLGHQLIQDAVIRNIEIIGEATKKLSDDFKSMHHLIPWKEMAGMRDKLIHDYLGVDIEVVWATVNEDIPFLKSLMLVLLKE